MKYAFPTSLDFSFDQGMTLRDYFAAKAMQALLTDSEWRRVVGMNEIALFAYKMADEMVKARVTE
jgi:hypothetical protein